MDSCDVVAPWRFFVKGALHPPRGHMPGTTDSWCQSWAGAYLLCADFPQSCWASGIWEEVEAL